MNIDRSANPSPLPSRERSPAVPLKAAQRGLSLVSLMIGMAIGIFLVNTVLQVYIDTKTSFDMRNVVSGVSENLRFAMDDMRRILTMAGRGIHAVEDDTSNRTTFPPVNTDQATAAADGAEFLYDGGSGDSDIIAVRYRIGPACGEYLSAPNAARPPMVRLLVDNDDNLVCELTTYDGGATTTRQVLTGGIQRMKVLYGVDDDGNRQPNRYLTASEVEKLPIPTGRTSPWPQVVTVRVGLIAGSEDLLPKTARKPVAETLNLLGQDFTEPDTERMYRVASTTISLRNFNPMVQRQ